MAVREEGAGYAFQWNADRSESRNIVEALINLNYLAMLEADEPEKVRGYASFSKDLMERLFGLLN